MPCQEYAAPPGPIFSNLLAYASAGPQKCYGSTEKQPQLEHCSKDVAPAVLLSNSSSSLIYLEKQQGMFQAARHYLAGKAHPDVVAKPHTL